MSELVLTRGAMINKDVAENFVSVTYTSRKRKQKSTTDSSTVNSRKIKLDDSDNETHSDPKKDQEREMKRLRWEVMKFGSSAFKGTEKEKARVALAIELGAKAPKNRNQNYKLLKQQRNWEKKKAARQTESQSGYTRSLVKQKTRKNVKKDKGILDPYGKVEKGKTR